MSTRPQEEILLLLGTTKMLQRDILLLLKNRGELTARQIANATNRPVNSTIRSLQSLHAQGLVYQPRKSFWAVDKSQIVLLLTNRGELTTHQIAKGIDEPIGVAVSSLAELHKERRIFQSRKGFWAVSKPQAVPDDILRGVTV